MIVSGLAGEATFACYVETMAVGSSKRKAVVACRC